MKRKLATTSYPTVEVYKDENDNFVFKSHTIIKTSETKFKLDEEFIEDRLDGKKVKVTIDIKIWSWKDKINFRFYFSSFAIPLSTSTFPIGAVSLS